MKIQYAVKYTFIGILGLSAAFSANLAAKTYNFSSLVESVEKSKQLTNLPTGTSIVAIKEGEVVFQAHIGYADIANNIKVTGDTPYYIASVTKPFTALNTLLDIENRKLPPDLMLSDMFPDSEFKGLDNKAVGIHHLLTHTSAIDNSPLVLATAYSGEHNSESLRALVYEYSKNEPHETGSFKYARGC